MSKQILLSLSHLIKDQEIRSLYSRAVRGRGLIRYLGKRQDNVLCMWGAEK